MAKNKGKQAPAPESQSADTPTTADTPQTTPTPQTTSSSVATPTWQDIIGQAPTPQTSATPPPTSPPQTPQLDIEDIIRRVEGRVLSSVAKSFGIEEEVSDTQSLYQKIRERVLGTQSATSAAPREKLPPVENPADILAINDTDQFLRAYYKSRGFQEHEIDDIIEELETTGLKRMKAAEARAELRAQVARLREEQRRQQAEQERLQKEQFEQARQQIIKIIEETDNYGGIPLASDPSRLDNEKQALRDYLLTGQFVKETFLTGDLRPLVELAWLWKNRQRIYDFVKKATSNSQVMKLLADLERRQSEVGTPHPITPMGIPSMPSTKQEFDPKAFLAGLYESPEEQS